VYGAVFPNGIVVANLDPGDCVRIEAKILGERADDAPVSNLIVFAYPDEAGDYCMMPLICNGELLV
jgi:hypothetical protein